MIEFFMSCAIRMIEKELIEHSEDIQKVFIGQIKSLSDMLTAYLDEKSGLPNEEQEQDD